MAVMVAFRNKGDAVIKQAVILAGLVCLVLLLAACGTSLGTASERDHLGRYAAQAAVAKGQAIDPVARQAILEEPALRFPARIGLARLEKGAVSPVPQSEAEAWLVMVKDLGPGWGEFVPLSPLEVALVGADGEDGGDVMGCAAGDRLTGARCDPTDIATTVRDIRRSAGRQQLDAVLIYEVFAAGERSSRPQAVASWIPIDHLLALSGTGRPEGHAQGVLMDVRNGAVYGFAAGGADAAEPAAAGEAKSAVMGLAKETAVMLRDLRIELAEARAARAEVGD